MEEAYVPAEAAVKDEVSSLKDSQKVVEKFMAFAEEHTEVSRINIDKKTL
jgi:hypothetical protein